MKKLLLTAGIAMLAIAGTAQAATPRAHRPGLDCTNVQTMTTQWLCDAQMAASKPVKRRPVRCKAGYVRETARVRKRVHGKIERVKQTECVRAPAKAATLAQPSPTAGAPAMPPSGATDPAPTPSVIGVGNVPGCLSGADPTPYLREYDASVLRVIVSEQYGGQGLEGQAIPCMQDAIDVGARVSLVIQWLQSDTPTQVAALTSRELAQYAPYAWSVSLGNEEELNTAAVGVDSAAEYAADWQAAEPVVAAIAPRAIRVAGEVSPWGFSLLQQAYADGLPGVQAVAIHPYANVDGSENVPTAAAWCHAHGLEIWATEGLDAPGAWDYNGIQPIPLSQMAGADLADVWMA